MTSNTKTKPFLKWVGGKGQLLFEITQRLPPSFDVYYEPFVGGGAVFFHLVDRLTKAHLSDTNAELMNTYEVVQKHLVNLMVQLSIHKNVEYYYYQLRNADRTPEYEFWCDVERAGRFIYLNKTCFNGLYRVNAKGHFNSPFGKYDNPKILDEDTLRECSRVLNSIPVTLSCSPYQQTLSSIEKESDPKKVFVYLDPPYIPLNKTSSFVSYSKDGFSLKDHEQLLDYCNILTQMGVKWMQSNSSTPEVFSLYKNYNIHSVAAKRQVASHSSSRKPVLETIITNY